MVPPGNVTCHFIHFFFFFFWSRVSHRTHLISKNEEMKLSWGRRGKCGYLQTGLITTILRGHKVKGAYRISQALIHLYKIPISQKMLQNADCHSYLNRGLFFFLNNFMALLFHGIQVRNFLYTLKAVFNSLHLEIGTELGLVFTDLQSSLLIQTCHHL